MFTKVPDRPGSTDKGRKWHFVSLASGIVTGLALLKIYLGGEDAWIGWTTLGFFGPGVLIAAIQWHRPRPSSAFKDGYTVKRSPWTAISYMLLCAGWMLGGIQIGIHHPYAGFIVQPFLLCCAFGLLMALWRFADPAPLVTITQEGYFDRTLKAGTIPWSQITGAAIVNHQGTDLLSLQLKDPSLLEQKQGALHMLNRKLDDLVGFELMHLGIVELDAAYIDQALDYVLSRCALEAKPSRHAPAEADLRALCEL